MYVSPKRTKEEHSSLSVLESSVRCRRSQYIDLKGLIRLAMTLAIASRDDHHSPIQGKTVP
jgi:hypothetical protein